MPGIHGRAGGLRPILPLEGCVVLERQSLARCSGRPQARVADGFHPRSMQAFQLVVQAFLLGTVAAHSRDVYYWRDSGIKIAVTSFFP